MPLLFFKVVRCRFRSRQFATQDSSREIKVNWGTVALRLLCFPALSVKVTLLGVSSLWLVAPFFSRLLLFLPLVSGSQTDRVVMYVIYVQQRANGVEHGSGRRRARGEVEAKSY